MMYGLPLYDSDVHFKRCVIIADKNISELSSSPLLTTRLSDFHTIAMMMRSILSTPETTPSTSSPPSPSSSISTNQSAKSLHDMSFLMKTKKTVILQSTR